MLWVCQPSFITPKTREKGGKLLDSIGCVRGDNMLTSSGEVEVRLALPVKVDGVALVCGLGG